MKVPEIFIEEAIAVFLANQVSYALVYRLSHGYVRYLDADQDDRKFDAEFPPEHIFDADSLRDTLHDVDENIKDELEQLLQVCYLSDCRYFRFDFNDYEIIKDSDEEKEPSH